jgi:hypothetical protein
VDGWEGKIILFITKSNMISPFKKQLKACEKVAFLSQTHTPLGFHFPLPSPSCFCIVLRSINMIYESDTYNSLESLTTTTSTGYDGM